MNKKIILSYSLLAILTFTTVMFAGNVKSETDNNHLDLVVSELEIVGTNCDPSLCRVNATITIKNTGTISSPPQSSLIVLDSQEFGGGQTYLEIFQVPSLNPGQSWTREGSLPFAIEVFTTYRISAKADHYELVKESDENNNEKIGGIITLP